MTDRPGTEPELRSWARSSIEAAGRPVPVYRTGEGPGVLLLHEMPGLTGAVVAFGEHLVARGFHVAMPHLIGAAVRPDTRWQSLTAAVRLCISREFFLLARSRTSPLLPGLLGLARTVHAEQGGPGVGVVGMCLTGGFALASMVEPAVVAPVLAQPALPLTLGRRRAADLGVDPADLAHAQERARAGCPALGVRFAGDGATGTRFDTLEAALGPAFVRVDLPGRGHATLTADRDPEAVGAVVGFLERRLRESTP